MVKSMTGFGRCEVSEGDRKMTVEMKSVNHRYLDVNIKMPKKLNFFESAIRSLLKTYLQRGKVDLFVTCEDLSETKGSLKYNRELAAEYLKYLKQMSEEFGLENDVKAGALSRYPEVLVMEEGQEVPVELWVCNDTPQCYRGCTLYYEVVSAETRENKYQGRNTVDIQESDAVCIGEICLPSGMSPGQAIVRAALLDERGGILHTNEVDIMVKEAVMPEYPAQICAIGEKAEMLVKSCGNENVGPEIFFAVDEEAGSNVLPDRRILLADDAVWVREQWSRLEPEVKAGGRVVLLELEAGEYCLGEMKFRIQNSSMLPMNFVSRATGHPLVEQFEPRDFQNWYDKEYDMIRPILESTVSGEGLTPILTSGNTDAEGNWGPAAAAAEIKCGKGSVIVCQLKLAGRTEENPAAKEFACRIMTG